MGFLVAHPRNSVILKNSFLVMLSYSSDGATDGVICRM